LYHAPRGTSDVLPEDQPYWQVVEQTGQSVARLFGYRRVRTPLFESADLFVRGVGIGTDIVEKEMYTFEDRGGESLTLLPEGTASICRAYLEHGMASLPQPVRLFYHTPIFRYERPQSGRYRQHHQFGVEALGDEDPSVDAEVIELGWRYLTGLGLRELSLYLNSIGDFRCRPAFVDALKQYYQPLKDSVCTECRVRLERAPLRLLDCKEDSCQILAKQAPHTLDYLCSDCNDHWQNLIIYLDELGIPYTVNHGLVRGLDYYTRTVFEIKPHEEGSQTTILAGGRYDGLIEELGGRPTPGIGFGSGIERIVLNLKRQDILPPDFLLRPVVIVLLGAEAKIAGIALASHLRDEAIITLIAPSGRSLKAQMRYAGALNARHTIIIGEEELEKEIVLVRDMDHAQQKEVELGDLIKALKS
jgi:histidyl-tRNA synthetase